MPVRFPSIQRLETPDLVLREIVHADTDAYFALSSDQKVMKTWGMPVHQDRGETEKLIEYLKVAHKEEKMIRWAITKKGEDRLIGDVGYWRFVKERSRAEAGAKLAKEYWSGGFMTQALAAIVDFGFNEMELNTVEANVDPENPGARRLVEKVGFLQEGILKEHSWDQERARFTDSLLFTVHRSRWKRPW